MQRVPGWNPCTCDQVHVGGCSPLHGSRGTCRTQVEACPAGTESFQKSNRFYNDGGACMCHGETAHSFSSLLVDFEITQYGACQDGGGSLRCVFDSRSCEDGEAWISPEALPESTTCPCNKVRTGGCFHALKTTCAIDEDSCLADETFISPFVTMSRGFKCLLCDADIFQSDSNGSSSSADNSQSDSTGNSSPAFEGPGASLANSAALDSGEREISNVAFGLLLTVAVLAFLMTGVLAIYLWRVQRPATKGGKMETENEAKTERHDVSAVSVVFDDEPPVHAIL